MGNKDGQESSGQREFERKPCFFTDVDYANEHGVFTEPIRDISIGGVYIESESVPQDGETVNMLFSDYSGVDLVKLSGDVVRMGETGFAVKFSCESGADLKKLKSYINSL